MPWFQVSQNIRSSFPSYKRKGRKKDTDTTPIYYSSYHGFLGAKVTDPVMPATVQTQNRNVCSKSKQPKHKGQQMERDKKENPRKEHHHKQRFELALVPRMECLGPRVMGKVLACFFFFCRLCLLKFASSALLDCTCFK